MVRRDSLREIPLTSLSELSFLFSQSDLSEVVSVFIVRVHVLVLFVFILSCILLSLNLVLFLHITVLVEVLHYSEKFRTEVFRNKLADEVVVLLFDTIVYDVHDACNLL